MREFPECPRCGRMFAGARTPHGGEGGNRPFPDCSSGYCMNCHIGLTKADGVWSATEVGPRS
ncbi:MAG TPA: hypothetical protein VFS16_11775 [Acidimicrobiia bacterium]|nr:hypothetical protein [Acidimicrobiia bacterium]